MEYFKTVPEIQLLVCKLCSFGVIGSRVKGHLKEHNVAKVDRIRAAAWAQGLPVIQTKAELATMAFPADTSTAIPYIRPPQEGGLRCTFLVSCPFVATEKRRMSEHLVREHQVEQDARGRPMWQGPDPWRTGVFFQRLFKKGIKSSYFEVCRGHLPASVSTSSVTVAAVDQMADLFSAPGNQIREQEGQKVEGQDEFFQPNAWLARMGSARHLCDFSDQKGFLRELLVLDLAKPEGSGEHREDDDCLGHIFYAFDQVVRKAVKVARPTRVSVFVLFELNRKQINRMSRKPFHYNHRVSTDRNYRAVLKKFLAYSVRCMALSNATKRPPFQLTDKQEQAFTEMMTVADELNDMWAVAGKTYKAEGLQPIVEKLQETIVQYYLAVLDDEIHRGDFNSILVSYFTVASVREDGGWESPTIMTPKVSAILALSKLILLYWADCHQQKWIKEKVRAGWSQRRAEQEAPCHFDMVQEKTERFLIEDGRGRKPTPARWLIQLRQYGLAKQNSTATAGAVSWDGDYIRFKGIRLCVADISGMIHSAVLQCRKMLFENLLYLPESDRVAAELGLPSIPWDSIIDDPANDSVGYWFGRELLERLPYTRSWLFKKIWQNRRLREEWVEFTAGAISDEGQEASPEISRIQISVHKMQQYQQLVEQFLDILIFCFHLSGGGPARITELLTIRYRNTVNGGIRNIFLEGGFLMFVIGYHKGYARSNKLQVIHRFLPREVGELVVYYLWLVLPFWEDCQAQVYETKEFSAGIWTPTDGVYEEADGEVNEEEEGRGLASNEADEANEANDAAVVLGWQPRWTSERVRRVLQKTSNLYTGQTLNISAWRHMIIAIVRRYLRRWFQQAGVQKELVEGMGEGDESSGDEEDMTGGNRRVRDDVYDKQTGHGTILAGMVYGRLLSEGSFEMLQLREQYREISSEMHQLLGFQSAVRGAQVGPRAPGHKRKAPSFFEDSSFQQQKERWTLLRKYDINRQLRLLLGPEGAFQGLQEAAIGAIMRQENPVIVIMRTGGGKSMCFMLPAVCTSEGVTIVVVPLVALQGNMKERCEKMRIRAIEWESDRPHETAQLVFVTPESAMTKRFQTYVDHLCHFNRLDRIVVDEAHTILEGSQNFRPKLRQLGRLGLVGVQMVYLTATLRPVEEDAFCELLGWRRDEVFLLREKTTRPNIRYSVLELQAEEGRELDEVFQEVVDRKLEQFPWPAKIIIYCSTTHMVRAVAEHLGCDAYFRDIDTRDGKAKRLLQWMRNERREIYGEGRVIVATNALGLGIDVPDVRVVFHIGEIRRMKDYSQQSGRAGRDGQYSEAIVIQSRKHSEDAWNNAASDVQLRYSMDDYLCGSICRRIVLDSVMDGTDDRLGCRRSEAMCDVCQPDRSSDSSSERGSESSQSSNDVGDSRVRVSTADVGYSMAGIEMLRSRYHSRTSTEAQEIQLFEEGLAAWRWRGCAFCFHASSYTTSEGKTEFNVGGVWGHTVESCPLLDEGTEEQQELYGGVLVQVQGFERTLSRHVRRVSCCTMCFVPQELCNSWEDEVEGVGGWRRRQGGTCQYKGIMLPPVVLGLHLSADMFFQVVQRWVYWDGNEPSKEIENIEGLETWLMEQVVWGGMETNRLCQVFSIYGLDEDKVDWSFLREEVLN